MPRLNPEALTFGTFTASYLPVEQVIASAQALEAAGFDHVWSGDQLQFQHPHALWRPDLCDGVRANPKLAAKFALQPLMSVFGQHTRRVCIGQGVLDAIRRGPAILAQEFLTTQHFTQGRAIPAHEHPLGDDYSITVEGNMATLPLERALALCRQVPRAMVRNALYAGTPDDVAPRLAAEIEAGARHLALCNYVGFLSRAEAPAATQALLEVVRRLRTRFPELAERPATLI